MRFPIVKVLHISTIILIKTIQNLVMILEDVKTQKIPERCDLEITPRSQKQQWRLTNTPQLIIFYVFFCCWEVMWRYSSIFQLRRFAVLGRSKRINILLHM